MTVVPLNPNDSSARVASRRADVRELLRLREHDELPRLRLISDYLAGRHRSVYLPKRAQDEYRDLVDRSTVNLTRVIVNTFTQALFVDGYRHSDADDNLPAWTDWQRNRMDARQTGLHRAALSYGVAYNLILPGTDPITGEPAGVWTPLSPLHATAVYDDVVSDEWPHMLLVVRPRRDHTSVMLVDAESVWTWRMARDRQAEQRMELTFVAEQRHDLGITPAVRYVPHVDLDGGVTGEVEPLIRLQDQLNETTANMKLTETFAAFPQKWVTGMMLDDSGQPPMNTAVNRLLVGEDPDIKFGQFPAAELRQYLEARDSAARFMATAAQFPPHHALGSLQNVSAEALQAAEIQKSRKDAEHRTVLGEAHEQSFRLAALLAGDSAGGRDVAGQVVWRDVDNVNLALVADAWGKVASMLHVPVEMLWEKIPGWTQTDVERAKALAEQVARRDALNQATAFGVTGLDTDGTPT